MVAGLVVQLPLTTLSASSPPRRIVDLLAQYGVACEVRLLLGGVLARTHNSPADLGFTGAGYNTRTIQEGILRSQTYALQNGGRTLEMTPGGQWLDSMQATSTGRRRRQPGCDQPRHPSYGRVRLSAIRACSLNARMFKEA